MLDLTKNPIIYITRDIERALGLDLNTPSYFIISNSTPFAKSMSEGHNNVLLIESDKQLDTWELLQRLVHSEKSPQVADEESFEAFKNEIKKFNCKSQTNPSERFFAPSGIQNELNILVFKPTTQIEKICKKNNWRLLNPSAELSDKIEEKISGLEWLGELEKYLPKHKIDLCKNIVWEDKKFIIQFNHAHSGLGTILIESETQLEEIKQKFPDRPIKITKYISGPIFTSNNIVTKNKTLVGNISYQITGLQPFTDNPFTTIGNDWSFAGKYLNANQLKQYDKIVNDIGNKLKSEGWKGLFGIDVVVDESDGKIYLIEINARQPASTTYESQLQSQSSIFSPIRRAGNLQSSISTFEAHLTALLNIDLQNQTLIKIRDGAQIVQRVTKDIPSLHEPKYNKRPDFNIIKYNNTKPNANLMRIQSKTGIIANHNQFNELGKEVINILTI